MESLFNKTDNDKMVARINQLSESAKPLWGKMQVNQMLAHSKVPLKVAFGEVKLKRGLIGILFGGMAKKKLLKEGPFDRNLPTDPNFIIKGSPEFEVEKADLIGLVKRFIEQGKDAITKEPHPFFGKLTTEEWDALQWKHLDHHLRQFGG